MSEKEIATDIRTVGELIAVLSKLPANTQVRVADWEYGNSDYMRVYREGKDTYLEANADRVVERIWMNGEDRWIHYGFLAPLQTLCKLVICDGIVISGRGSDVDCPWCLYNMNRRQTMMNFSPPPAPYGKET